MIEIYDSLNIFDLLYNYAESNNCAVVYFVHKNFKDLTEDKQNEIFSFYEEFLPDDMYETLKQGRYNIIKFGTVDAAIMNAIEWFPPKVSVPDEDYFWTCYVIGPQGDIEYQNLDPVEHPEESDEGA